MGGGFKRRLSRMFRASLGSCRSRNIPYFIENPVFVPQTSHDSHPIDPLSPQVRTFPSMFRPRPTERIESFADDGFATIRSEVTKGSQCLGSDDHDTKGRTCPPASPVSPLNSYYKVEEFKPEEGKRRSKKTKQRRRKKKKSQRPISKKGILHLDSSSGETESGWFCTEDETETFFSSKSFSSDSSEIYRRNERAYRRKSSEDRRRKGLRRNSEMGRGTFDSDGKVQESFAVVKRSSDPYKDFRTSMVEMIVEKQLFATEDLETLLQCYLSLNSSHHHRVIMEVFNEIWDTLFSNWS